MPRLLLRALLLASLAVTGPALGGDEVDYSAPYLVVEDGELVTRYPDKQHEAVPDEAAGEYPAEPSDPGAAGEAGRGVVFGAALAALVIGLLLVVRRARRRSPRRASRV